ncbi:hypothetical protein PTSG_13008 [Salpingoeca rosetta]|uniref:I/LWEQ domain-containing protein n=1 Tax=Salpingoeca rosetta (strain ATCC 50818 / BSB-021) TaxID=946362 RepID=F2UQQ4_SALR5|nr:uncharacterized protein PTSG_13008 [Salpingoeca rosetta]EGD79959.1 hypothetical protein PTSG_13008 [Salpingoeca rosetta]|eukprot:XP_004988580.1 hypothetical protein PTSG_13008 [Salpingoeca rosetta]
MSLIRRQLNKLQEDGSLKNVLLELKHSAKSLNALINSDTRLLSGLEYWAKRQSPPISEFVKKMKASESELVSSFQQYLQGYEEYCKQWQDILEERRELRSVVHSHHKAEKAVRSAERHVKSAQRKEGRRQRREEKLLLQRQQQQRQYGSDASHMDGGDSDTFQSDASSSNETPPTSAPNSAPTSAPSSTPTSATASPRVPRKRHGSSELGIVEEDLAVKTEHEQSLRKRMHAKRLEVEQQIHDDLRSAYLNLARHRMNLLRTCANMVQHMAETAVTLPDVESIQSESEKGDKAIFVYAQHQDMHAPGVDTIWHRGHEFKAALDRERESARRAIESEKSTRDRQQRQMETTHELEKGSLQEQLFALQHEHQQLLARLKATSEKSEVSAQDAQDQLALMTSQLSSCQASVDRMCVDDVNIVLASTQSTMEADVLTAAVSDVTATTFLAQELGTPRSRDELGRKLAGFVRQYAITVRACQGALTQLSMGDAEACMGDVRNTYEAVDAFVKEAHERLSDMRGASENFGAVSAPRVDDVCSRLNAVYQRLERASDQRKEVPAHLTEEVGRAHAAVKDAIASMEDLKAIAQRSNEQLQSRNEAIVKSAVFVLESVESLINTITTLKKQVRETTDGTTISTLRAHRWFGALEAVVSAVLDTLPVWLECLRQFLTDGTQFERLQVSVRNLAASSAQLIILIQTSMTSEEARTTETMHDVRRNSRTLTTASHELIDALRAVNSYNLARAMVEDAAQLNEVQLKRLVMDSQVEALRLEQALDEERGKLAQLRRMLADQGGHMSEPEDDMDAI